MSLLEDLHRIKNASAEQKLAVIRSETRTRIATIKGFTMLLGKQSNDEKNPVDVQSSLEQILNAANEITEILEILTQHYEETDT